jgi:hypothetical protein
VLVYDKIGATYAVTRLPGQQVCRRFWLLSAWHWRHHDLLNRADFDGGYRLLTAELGAPKAKGGAR